MKRLLLVVIPGLVVAAVLLQYGTLSPCGVLRAQIREQAAREGGFGGFLANALPDSVIDGMLAAQYGSLSPGRCLSLALSGVTAPPPAAQQPQRQATIGNSQTDAARARQEAAERQARMAAERLERLENIAHQLDNYSAHIDGELPKFAPLEQQYRMITERMRGGLAREESIYGGGQAAVARSQLSVAITQAAIQTGQLHIQVQSARQTMAAKLQEMTQAIQGADQACQGARIPTEANPIPSGGQAWNAACLRFFDVEGKYQHRVSALRAAFIHAETVWSEEDRAQQEITREANIAVR